MSMTPDYGEPWDYDIEYDMALTKNGSVCDARRAVSCVNACAGMADPAAEIQAMLEAIREAHASFDELWNLSFDVPWATSEKAEAALAKLKPFTAP